MTDTPDDPFRRIVSLVDGAEPFEDVPDDGGGDDGPPEPPFGGDPGGGDDPDGIYARCAKLEQNDTDNGARLLAHFGPELLHVREVGWHSWRGTHWEREGGDEAIVRAAQDAAKRISLEADFMARTPYEERVIKAADPAFAKAEDDRTDDDKALIKDANEARDALKKRRIGRRKFGISSGNAARIAGMIVQAVPHCTVGPEALDANPMLFNVRNGTLLMGRVEDPENPDPDSKRFMAQIDLVPHDRAHLASKVAPAEYDPDATAPRWLAFMTRFQPREDVRKFLQVYHGLSLTGLTGEQVLVFNHGSGANGKSTFIEAISSLMGGYADLLNSESLTGQGQRRGDQATPDFARLPSVRLLRVSELPRGEPLKEALVKSLTGGEPMLARHLNKGFFKFTPTFKAAMSGNDLPTIGGVDHGIWRRMRLVPWSVTISDEERRPMGEILAEFEAERSGILNWLLDGLRIYLSEGLVTPPDVLAATASYREEMDPLAGFISSCVEACEGAETQARTMFEAFEAWCIANSVRPWKETAFGRAMKQKGFVREDKRIRVWVGVRLHDVPEKRVPRSPHEPESDEHD